MQKMTRIYQNIVTVDAAEKGWCMVRSREAQKTESVWGTGVCLVFYSDLPSPDENFPDEAFARKLEQWMLRQFPALVWIANPKEDQNRWNLTTAFGKNSHIEIGGYWIHFQKLLNESDHALTFSGVFGAKEETVSLAENKIVLDLTEMCGTLSFTLTPSPEEFLRLDAGMKYLRVLSEEEQEAGEFGSTEHIDLRVLRIEHSIRMPVRLMPAAPDDPGRSWFSLGTNPFLCSFLSPFGEPAAMVSKNAKLVFEKTAAAVSKKETGDGYQPIGAEWYLGIEGSFALLTDAALMPGYAGTEYFSDLSELCFVSGQSALLITKRETAKIEMSEKQISAPWLSVKGNTAKKAVYYSSPVSMTFFERKESEGQPYLCPYSAKAGEYSHTASPAFPALPWSGLTFVPDTFSPILTENGISDLRYQILTGGRNLKSDGKETEKLLVAPCGLCVGIQPDSGVWNWVGIAQTHEAGLPAVKIEQPSEATQKALQQTKCLLKAATKEEFCSLGKAAVSFAFQADGWKLLFSEDTWKENSLFLLKYTEEQSIRSILADSRQLEALISAAYDSQGNRKREFEPVMEILDRKEFQGILLLGGSAETEHLIPELQTVLRWGDASKLHLVYAVITNGAVSLDGGSISVAKSEVDALLLYEGTPQTAADARPFDFFTREMAVVIKQTKVTSFHSRSELLLYRLFGSKLRPFDPLDKKELRLSGRLETAGGLSSYKFSLEEERTYRMSDSAMDSLCVKNVLLSGDAKELALHISGTQSYQNYEELDVFSYEEVGFDGVLLLKNDAVSSVDYSAYRLLSENSVPREHSLVTAFKAAAVKAMGEISDDTPDSLGFSSIQTPIRQGTLGFPWNGILWEIPLNSSGALGKNEALSMELLGAWSGNNCYIGIRTGGVFGKTFSLQGILTAGFSGITLEKERQRMLFKLHGFALKALGITFPGKGVEVSVIGENGKIAWYAAYEEEKEGRGRNGGSGDDL